ncbi:MAG: type II toxin-antitoxin system RelE/ParE family toxin [Spirochaetes bacterium]|nr:type II toxin-antitoxin system RelE/ParE family toxin [Spirochaetota bacterium]
MINKWKVIYFEDEHDCSEIFDFIEGQKENNQIKLLNWIGKLEELGPNLPRPYADYLDNGIYELRIKLTGDQIRILYFFCYKEFIILTHQFRKNSDKVPVKEIKKALTIKENFIKRFDESTVRRLYNEDI